MQELQVVKERLQSDYDKLKAEEGEREKRIKELSGLSEKREQAKSDLKGSVTHGVAILNSSYSQLFGGACQCKS
ncbi:unnamed protein product [Anisakis simplex]|uniref:Uncharacterized protein n=1 Tax=Anisakis simplex TaxID=6269 RepID=A0A3P6Q7N0_ANISI|nr:unnamed protein product [Anisakis simplex]